MDAQLVGPQEHIDRVDAILDCGVGRLHLHHEATLAQQAQIGLLGVGGAALLGGGVGDDDEVAGCQVVGVGLAEETHHVGGVLGRVFRHNVEVFAPADHHQAEASADVEVDADK